METGQVTKAKGDNMEFHSQELDKLFAALCKMQATLGIAEKESNNPFYKSKYADLQKVWETVQKPLTDNGLCICQGVIPFEGQTCLMTILGHISGQWIKSISPIKTNVNGQDLDAQKLVAACTYTRRMNLGAMTGCVAGEADDDGNTAAAVDHVQKSEKVEPARPAYYPPKPASVTPSGEIRFITEKQKKMFEVRSNDFPQYRDEMKAKYGDITKIPMAEFSDVLLNLDTLKATKQAKMPPAPPLAPSMISDEECPF